MSGLDESASPSNTREALLDTGRYAARQLGRWEDALDLNTAVIASMRDRAAPAAEMARSRFNDYYPLLYLGRADEALALLLECRQVFLDARDIGMLGRTFGALAAVEDTEGSVRAAVSDLRAFGADAAVPADVPGLCRQVGGIPGADLDRLLAALAPDPDALEQPFQELVAVVREVVSRGQE